MHYILLIYENTARWSELSKEEKNRIHEACGAWHGALLKSGTARSASGLHPVSTATTVRLDAGRPFITDGPFAETKDVLGGFEIIECANLDEAIVIAKRFPALEVGFAVEVRPLRTDGCREE
jgi:hypothetical protein